MIACPNCGKENQDHYKFCLGCGSDLPRVEKVSKPSSIPTPPTGIPAVSAPDATIASTMESSVTRDTENPAQLIQLSEPETKPEPMPVPKQERREPVVEAEPAFASNEMAACTNCGNRIQPGFAFCGACGTKVPGAKGAVPPVSNAGGPSGRLVLIQPDGSEGGHVDIPTTEVAIGRDAGGFFGNDPFLSPTHAILYFDKKNIVIRDAGSLNGIYIKLEPSKPVQIYSGDIFRMGQEVILFEEIDRGNTASDGTEKMGAPIEGLWGRLALIVGRGRLGNAFPIGGQGVAMGRERGNILFPEDGYVSGLHLKLYTENNKFYLSDLGSSNGTFKKISEDTPLPSGSFLLMGQQLFRIDI